jgi:hypothetical protein
MTREDPTPVQTPIQRVETLEVAIPKISDGVWIRRAKAWSIAAGGTATIVVALAALFRPETVARETAGAAAAEISKLQDEVSQLERRMRGSVRRCERAVHRGVAQARSEADNVRTMLLGWLLGQRGSTAPTRQLNQALTSVVKQLGAKAKGLEPLVQQANAPAPIPHVDKRKPTKLEQLSKGAE